MRYFKERWGSLIYTYGAVTVGLLISVFLRSAHIHSLGFWATAVVAFCIVTVFDLFVLAMLEKEEPLDPSQFLFRMMFIVVIMQAAFACIYHFTATSTDYLLYTANGTRVADFVDALYFSGITLMTVGYGDIVPRGDFRFTAVAEVYGGTLFIFAFFTCGLSIVVTRHQERRRKDKDGTRHP